MSVVLLLVIPTLITAGLGYFILILWLAVSEMRRNRRAQWSIEEQSQPPFTVFFLVPCLDEELVITETLRSALREGGPDSVAVVVDDGSQDATASAALEAGEGQVGRTSVV